MGARERGLLLPWMAFRQAGPWDESSASDREIGVSLNGPLLTRRRTAVELRSGTCRGPVGSITAFGLLAELAAGCLFASGASLR